MGNPHYTSLVVTISREALQIPNPTFSEGTATLSKTIAAVRLVNKDGRGELGSITELSSGCVDLCGPGYNEQTVKVRLNEEFNFVFKDDLD